MQGAWNASYFNYLPEGSGRITIGGVDIREISRSYLRGKVGIVLQEPFLFSRTIAEKDVYKRQVERCAGVADAGARCDARVAHLNGTPQPG